MRVLCSAVVFLMVLPGFLIGCQDEQLIKTDAPKQFSMKVDAILQEREVYEPNLERLFFWRNVFVVGSTFYGHLLLMSNDCPRDVSGACSLYEWPLAGYSAALLLDRIMKRRCRKYERLIKSRIIDQLQKMDRDKQEQYIDELSQANEKLFYDCFYEQELRTCQKMAYGFKDHAE